MYDLAILLLWIVALIAGRLKAPWAGILSSWIHGLRRKVMNLANLTRTFSLFKPSRWYSCLAFDLTYGWREEVNFSCTCLNYWYFSADRDFNFVLSKVPWALKMRLTCCWVSVVSGCCLRNSHGYLLPGTTFGDICGQELKMLKNELSVVTFGYICGQGLEMLKMNFLGPLLAICAARSWNAQNKLHRLTFDYIYVRPGAGNA